MKSVYHNKFSVVL